MHIGLIGGIGPAATIFYYERLSRAAANADPGFDLTIVEADLSTLLKNMQCGDRSSQAAEFACLSNRLADAGADRAVITSLAGHFCIDELAQLSPIPLISALPALDAHFRSERLTRVGLLGTRVVMESGLYGGVTSCDLVAPLGSELQATHEAYLTLATDGEVSPSGAAFFHDMGSRLVRDQSADAIALAGTDLYVAFEGADVPYRVIDCAEVHVDAIIAAAEA